MKKYGIILGLGLGIMIYINACKPTENTTEGNSTSTAIKASPISGLLDGASAHWVTRDRLLWKVDPDYARYELHFSKTADIQLKDGSLQKSNSVGLRKAGITDAIEQKHPHLKSYQAFSLMMDESTIREALRGQLIAVAYDENGKVAKATRVQFAPLLDELYLYTGSLGPVYKENEIQVKLWAPTAQDVTLYTYNDKKERVDTLIAAKVFPNDGVWVFTGDKSLDKKFYRFEITVFHAENDKVNTYEVTDPYSVSLSTDSHFSQFIDIANEPSVKPEGWDSMKKALPKWTDISIYEGHVRDFSVFDVSTSEEHRGKYKAFTYNGKNGKPLSVPMEHLIRLQKAGLTHLHLLPLNDLGSNNEDPDTIVDITDAFERLCLVTKNPLYDELCATYGKTPIIEVFKQWVAEDPLTEKIQAIYADGNPKLSLRKFDTFNWGYDPFHFFAPEGVYATNPEGPQRILELREMVKALDEIGLKLVVDVVYNHTFEGGMDEKSVLDKIVPWYYQRLDAETGEIETSTCCFNTAAENYMMEKLLIDSVIFWAKYYKIDSFRFDLMGHHPRYVMENLMHELSKLTLEADGVDGKNIYVYGEGWNFGEVANNRMFKQASQFNMGGTGIGNFNDRLRDGVKGGTFTDRGREQGFSNGRYIYPNEESAQNEQTLGSLLWQADNIRVGLAGNLSTYRYINREGEVVTGGTHEIGYTLRPEENVNYIDKHDNETFWDNTQPKLPSDMGMQERVRVHLLGQSFVNYGQGVPFHQMGTDILRSKSMDRNSYNSGDWFNRVDFTMQTHNWTTGIPPRWDNENRWDDIRKVMSNANIKVEKGHMEFAHIGFMEQLKVRYSSPLFRLETAEEIHARVQFHNTGKTQLPGVIVMSVSDGTCAGADLDPNVEAVLVIFNANRKAIEWKTDWSGFELHPVHKQSADAEMKKATVNKGTFTVPAISTVVFVKKQGKAQGAFGCNPH